MKKKHKLFLFFVVLATFLGFFVIGCILDVPIPSAEEFNHNREKYELLLEKLAKDKEIDFLEKRTRHSFKFNWVDELNDLEMKEYTLKIGSNLINSDFVRLEGDFYVSREKEKKYNRKHVDEYLSLMEKLSVFSINKTIRGGVSFFKDGAQNQLRGYGYTYEPSSNVVYQPRYIEKKINDHWYIIAIFN